MKLIEWITNNLFTVMVIAGVLAQLIKAVRGTKEQGEGDAPPQGEPAESQWGDLSDEEERTRRIREEIRRKIAERGGDAAPAPQIEPEPELRPAPTAYEEPPVVTRSIIAERAPEAAAALRRIEAQRTAEILEEQATLAEKMRELEQMKAAAQRRAAFEALSVSQAAVQREKTRGAVLEDLRNPEALRRAFILREVLGPPVGLR